MALALDVDGIFMEVHDNPDKSLCDAPTQWYLNKLEWLLDYLNIKKIKKYIFFIKIYYKWKKNFMLYTC